MPHKEFDRSALKIRPLAEREDRAFIDEDHVKPDEQPRVFSKEAQRVIDEAVARIKAARAAGKSRMLTFGAHAIGTGSHRYSSS